MEKHHKVELVYPCLDLKNSGNAMLLFPVYAADQRYEPKPLINAPTAEAHSNYGSCHEWRHFSYTPANTELTPAEAFDREFPPPDTISEHARLRRDMDFANTRAGETTLRCFTYMSTGHGRKPQPAKIRIHRVSRFYIAGPKTAPMDVDQLEGTYHFPISDMTEWSAPAASDPEWVFNLLGLMLRKTDRAIKHVGHMLYMQNMVERNLVWKPERQLLLEQAMERYTKRTAIKTAATDEIATEDTPTCAINGKDLTLTESAATTLLCGHMFCKSCLLAWCHEKGPVEVGCPLCRATIFTQKRHITQLLTASTTRTSTTRILGTRAGRTSSARARTWIFVSPKMSTT